MREILIVDDERFIRDLLSRWLAAEGYALQEADGADRALDVLASRPIAAVLIDKDMPGHDGTWLIAQIQQRHPGVAMLLASGDASISPRVSLSAGVLDYLVKPFTQAAVIAAVKAAVAWHEAASKAPQADTE